MNRGLRIGAAVLIVGSAIVLFTTDSSKLFASLLILGNLLSLAANLRDQRS